MKCVGCSWVRGSGRSIWGRCGSSGFIRLYEVPLKPPWLPWTGRACPHRVRALALPGVPWSPAACRRLPSFLARLCPVPSGRERSALSPCRRAVWGRRGWMVPEGGPSGCWAPSGVARELWAGPGPPLKSWWDPDTAVPSTHFILNLYRRRTPEEEALMSTAAFH